MKNRDGHNINTRNNSYLHKVTNSFNRQCKKIPVYIQSFPFTRFKTIVQQKLYTKAYDTASGYLDYKVMKLTCLALSCCIYLMPHVHSQVLHMDFHYVYST